MKKRIVVGVALLTGLVSISCTPIEEKAGITEQPLIDADKELDRSIAETQSAVKVYQTGAHKKLNESNDQLAALRRQAEKESGSIQAKHFKKMEDLQEQRDRMKTRLDSYQYDNRNKWEAFKKEFNTELNQLADTLRACM